MSDFFDMVTVISGIFVGLFIVWTVGVNLWYWYKENITVLNYTFRDIKSRLRTFFK